VTLVADNAGPERAPSSAESRPGGASWRASIAVALGLATLAATIAWMSMSPSGLAKDFTLSWTAANHVLAGHDPYGEMRPTGVYPFNVPFYYPLPAALLAVPFAPLPVRYAGIAFVFVSFGVSALALMRDRAPRAALLLGFPAVMAATLGQWSPLLLAATVVPAVQLVLPVKPTLGAAAFLSRPSRVGVVLALAVVGLCFLVQPGWLASWRAVVAGAWTSYTPPLRWGHGLGIVLLAAFIWWRDPDARLLGVMVVAPQLPLFYDQLLVQAAARTPREVLLLVGASWVGGLAWAFQGSPNAGSARAPTLLILLTIYLPALGVVAWRNLRRRLVSPAA
jgi:hypothetical protein